METFFEKLKSWKRWLGVLAAVLPIVLEALNGAMGWPDALRLSVMGALGAMGLLAADDHSKRKNAVAMASLAEPGKD